VRPGERRLEVVPGEQDRGAFLEAIQAVGSTRRRNGAMSWRVFRDLGEEGRFVERYIIASWAEYVRLRSRMTMADSRLQQRVAELQRADVPIRVSRLVGVTAAEYSMATPSGGFAPSSPMPARTSEPT